MLSFSKLSKLKIVNDSPDFRLLDIRGCKVNADVSRVKQIY